MVVGALTQCSKMQLLLVTVQDQFQEELWQLNMSAGRREFLARHPLALRLWTLYHSTVSGQDTNKLESRTVYNCLVMTNLKPHISWFRLLQQLKLANSISKYSRSIQNASFQSYIMVSQKPFEGAGESCTGCKFVAKSL